MKIQRGLLGILVLLIVTLIGTTAWAKRVEITRYATDGFVTMPDGKKLYVFGFTDDPNGDAKVPAPTIIVDEGDDVYLALFSKGMKRSDNLEGHTIHLHGFASPAMYDGVPEFSVSVPPGGKYTYYFKAEKPGTYAYHCHVRAPVHIEMGMYGMLIVRPKMGEHYAYNDQLTFFEREYVYMLSEFDHRLHDAESKKETCCGETFNVVDMHPQYWIANVPFPDTLKDPHLLKLRYGERILVRMFNIGQESHAMHIHGVEAFTIIGRDHHMLQSPIEANTLHIAPGESYDMLITMPDYEKNPEYAKVLRYKAGFDEMYPWHDHMDYKATNNGVFPGGMFIPIKVIPSDSKEKLNVFNHP